MKLIYTILTFTFLSYSVSAQLSYTVASDDAKKIQVSLTASSNYLSPPFNSFSNSNFTIKFPDGLSPEPTFTVTNSSTIIYQIDGTPTDGGDGFKYQKFSNSVPPSFTIGDGNTIEVADVSIVGDYPGMDVFENFSLVPNTTDAFIETSMENFLGEQINNAADETVNVLLPISLSRFTATKGESSVNLNWSTSSEINGSHFDVQRSQNLSDWSTIGTVNAIGESSTEQNYDLVDKDLPLSTRSTKTFYYRLSMVDNDGSSGLSEVRTVRFDQDGADFIVYPNPTINEVFVNLSSITSETGPATMNVINMKGERVKEVTLSTNDDISVDISNITAGVYYFIVRQGEETFTQKVIKID